MILQYQPVEIDSKISKFIFSKTYSSNISCMIESFLFHERQSTIRAKRFDALNKETGKRISLDGIKNSDDDVQMPFSVLLPRPP